MKRLLIATACGLLMSPGLALAGCTQEDLEKKVAVLKSFEHKFEELAPDKQAEMEENINATAEKHAAAFKKGGDAKDADAVMEEMCKLYDEMIALTK